jgi:hypothetical protein
LKGNLSGQKKAILALKTRPKKNVQKNKKNLLTIRGRSLVSPKRVQMPAVTERTVRRLASKPTELVVSHGEKQLAESLIKPRRLANEIDTQSG